jgi:uncharacterized membrane protein YjjP (DUF1212 family)
MGAATTAEILRIAMRVAVTMLSSGAQSDEVEAAITSITEAYGVHDVQASVTFSGITVSHDRSGTERPTTLLHIVRDRTSDFARLAAASDTVRRIRAGELDPEAASAALDQLETQESPYGPLVSFVAPGISAAGSTVLFGGNLAESATTLAIAFLVQPALAQLDRSSLPPFFRLVFGAAASTILVALCVAIGLPIAGGLVLTGSLLRFLPGYALVSGFRDLIDQSVISGTARLSEALLLAAAVAGGTTIGLAVAGLFDISLTVVAAGWADWSVPASAVAAVLAVGGFAIRLGVPPGAVGQAALLGAIAWLGFIAAGDAGPAVDPSLATLGASIAIGVAGRLLARRAQAPAALWVVPAILPLLPGLQIVQAMLASTDAGRVAGLVEAAATAFLIGTGVATGDIIVLAIRRVRDRVVSPAVGAVTSGLDVLVVSPVERVVSRARGGPARQGDPRAPRPAHTTRRPPITPTPAGQPGKDDG